MQISLTGHLLSMQKVDLEEQQYLHQEGLQMVQVEMQEQQVYDYSSILLMVTEQDELLLVSIEVLDEVVELEVLQIERQQLVLEDEFEVQKQQKYCLLILKV